MSERRMFSRTVLESDSFIELSTTAQILYIYLCLSADDDGAVSNPKTVARTVCSDIRDMDELVSNGFIIAFDSGIVIICHWRVHNKIQKDRYKPTMYKTEFAKIKLDGNVYRLADTSDTTCAQNVSNVDSQVRIGEDRVGKESEGKTDLPCGSHAHGKKPYGEFSNVMLTDDELSKLRKDVPDCERYIEELSNYMARTGKTYKSHYATIKAWYRRDIQNGKQQGTLSVKSDSRDYDVDILEVLADE